MRVPRSTPCISQRQFFSVRRVPDVGPIARLGEAYFPMLYSHGMALLLTIANKDSITMLRSFRQTLNFRSMVPQPLRTLFPSQASTLNPLLLRIWTKWTFVFSVLSARRILTWTVLVVALFILGALV
jgi:hypothetical protein